MFFRNNKPSINSISCDTTNWSIREESEAHRMWMTHSKDAVLFRLFNTPPTFPYDFSDIEAARKFYASQANSNGGVMLSTDFHTVNGIDVIKGVFKYRSPQPNSMAMYFVGILAFLFRNFSFQINTESLETGTTGMREAAIGVLSERQPAKQPEEIIVNSVEEMFEHMRNKPLSKTPADLEEHDALFPNHPLSKVRSLQEHIINTIEFDSVVKNSKSYKFNQK